MWLVSQNVGIAVSYHRQLTHRGFTTPKRLQHAMALCRAMSLAHPHAGAVRACKRHQSGAHGHSSQREQAEPDITAPIARSGSREVTNEFAALAKQRDASRDPYGPPLCTERVSNYGQYLRL